MNQITERPKGYPMIEYYETSYELDMKKNSDMEAILFGEEDCHPSHGYGPTLRPYHLFHFVTRGKGRLEIGGRRFEIHAGDAFLVPAEELSYYEASKDDPWSYSWTGLTGVRATQYVGQILTVSPEKYIIRGLDTKKYAAVIHKAAILKGNSPENYFASQISLYTLFSFFVSDLPDMRNAEVIPSLASRIKFYIDAKYTEKLRIEEIAEYFGIHPNHLSRLFRENYDITPKLYLNRLKMEKAALLLRATDNPIVLIAESIGFEDQHAFSKLFKKHWGMSPLAYRKQN